MEGSEHKDVSAEHRHGKGVNPRLPLLTDRQWAILGWYGPTAAPLLGLPFGWLWTKAAEAWAARARR